MSCLIISHVSVEFMSDIVSCVHHQEWVCWVMWLLVLFMLGVDHLGSNSQTEVVSCDSSYWLMWAFCATNIHWFFSPMLSGGPSSLKEVSGWDPKVKIFHLSGCGALGSLTYPIYQVNAAICALDRGHTIKTRYEEVHDACNSSNQTSQWYQRTASRHTAK
jgi:hypothetical protein